MQSCYFAYYDSVRKIDGKGVFFYLALFWVTVIGVVQLLDVVFLKWLSKWSRRYLTLLIVQSVLETRSVFLFYFKVFLKVAEEADAEEEGTKYFRPIVVQILLVTVTLSFYLQVKVCCLKGE